MVTRRRNTFHIMTLYTILYYILHIYPYRYIYIIYTYCQANSQFWEAVDLVFLEMRVQLNLWRLLRLMGGGKKKASSVFTLFIPLTQPCGLYRFMSGFVFFFLFRRGHNLAYEPPRWGYGYSHDALKPIYLILGVNASSQLLWNVLG